MKKRKLSRDKYIALLKKAGDGSGRPGSDADTSNAAASELETTAGSPKKPREITPSAVFSKLVH